MTHTHNDLLYYILHYTLLHTVCSHKASQGPSPTHKTKQNYSLAHAAPGYAAPASPKPNPSSGAVAVRCRCHFSRCLYNLCNQPPVGPPVGPSVLACPPVWPSMTQSNAPVTGIRPAGSGLFLHIALPVPCQCPASTMPALCQHFVSFRNFTLNFFFFNFFLKFFFFLNF